jgi:hypothetical protein
MPQKISDLIYRITNPVTVLVITLIFCLYVFYILPNSADVDRIVGESLLFPLFKFLVYAPTDFYGQLDAYGPEGRAEFVSYRIINATLWLLTLGAFLALSTSALLRYALARGSSQLKLNLIAPLPSLFDFLENQLQNVLVMLYPDRYDGLAVLAATFTAIKWVTLLLAFLILLYAIGRALNARLSR